MCSAEKPAGDQPQPPLSQSVKVNQSPLGSRQRKETMLPRITQLALEGHSGPAIAAKLAMPARTVNRRLQETAQKIDFEPVQAKIPHRWHAVGSREDEG